MRHLLAALALWIVVSALSAKPLPPPRVKDKTPPAATLTICGPTNWGLFSQEGRAVWIEGTTWTFIGEIRPDGRIQGTWTTGTSTAFAVYTIQPDGKSLVGHYGYAGSAEILGNGNLVGNVIAETISAEKVQPAPIN